MITNERGIAMPMALMVMVILTALMAAFAVLATSEPQIASNQVASAQARAVAESAVERVLWALTTGEASPATPGVITLDANYNLLVVPVAYNGTTETTLGVGSFKVSIVDGAGCAPVIGRNCQINEKAVTARGYVPNATNPIAIKKIISMVTRVKWIDPQCGLCAGAEDTGGTATVKVGGSAAVNASLSPTGPPGNVPAGAYCSGVVPTSAVGAAGTVTVNGTPNLTPPPGYVNSPPCPDGAACSQTFPPAMTLTDADMATLKAMAMAKGQYFKGNPPWNGGLPADSYGNVLNGLVFVDTLDASVLTKTTPLSNVPTVSIHSTGTWSGWLIVAGNIDVSGGVSMTGMLYAQNTVTLHGTGGGGFVGAVISTNRMDQSSTNIDDQNVGNAPISYNCPAVRNGGGFLSQNWFLMPGTYREVSGS